MNKLNHIIFCIIDDVRSEHLFDYIQKGMLPNIGKLLRRGIYSKKCITDFPSSTYPSQVSMITGTYTGNYLEEPCHGVPSYNWIQRNKKLPHLRSYGSLGTDGKIDAYKINGDIGNNCRTLLEMIGDENTISITQFINRGARYFFPERKTKLILYYLILKYALNQQKMMIRANTLVVKKLVESFKQPKKFFELKEPPIASLLWFFSSDVVMHLYGYDSDLYLTNLIHIDNVMGFLLKELEKLELLDSTGIVIASDHGNYRANEKGSLDHDFYESGINHYHPRKSRNGNMNIGEFEGLGFFNFKGDEMWNHPTKNDLECFGPKKINLIQKLFKIEGVKMLFHRNDENTFTKGSIILKGKFEGSNKSITNYLEYKGVGSEYKTKLVVDDPDYDIFGYSRDNKASKLLDNNYHTIDEWLECTHHLNYPLYPDLIPRHFKNPRGSDVILNTEGKVIYNIQHGKKLKKSLYTHDIGLRESCVVPLIIAGSEDIPIKEIEYCKITDIVPTLLKLLGKKPHYSVVGNSLI